MCLEYESRDLHSRRKSPSMDERMGILNGLIFKSEPLGRMSK